MWFNEGMRVLLDGAGDECFERAMSKENAIFSCIRLRRDSFIGDQCGKNMQFMGKKYV